MPAPSPRRARAVLVGALAGLLTVAALSALESPARAAPAAASKVAVQKAGNVVTPGSFTGYGFDQCLAPSQAAMDRWLQSSPFLAVGIYISGDSRACRYQPNLTTTWISTQLARGWRLLPITLGPQASCQPRYPRYGTTRRSPRGRRDQDVLQGDGPGPDRGRQVRRGGDRPRHRPGQHALVRPRGFRLDPDPLPRVRTLLPQRLVGRDPQARLQVRRLLQCRVRDAGTGQRPGQPAPPLPPARPDLGGPLGRRGQHEHVVPPPGRLAATRPGEAVPGRPRREVGRRHHQHRSQLPRRRPRLGRGGRDPLRRRPDELPHLRPDPRAADQRRPSRRSDASRRCSACSRSRASSREQSPGPTASRPSRRCAASRPPTGSRCGTPGRARTG